MADDTLNYKWSTITPISAWSPDELCEKIHAIKTPIKIDFIVYGNNKYHAFVTGDIRIKKIKKGNKNGSSNM